jgi:uncharacterized protein (TIRG00374 family)
MDAPPARARLPWSVWLGFAVSAVFLVYFFRAVDWARLGEVFRRASWFYLIPTIALAMGTYPVRSYRWSLLLPKSTPTSFRIRLNSTMIGFMATSIFPLRAGEVVRAVVFSMKTKIPIGVSLASLVLERLYDLIFVLMTLGVCLVMVPSSAGLELAKKAGLIFAVLVVLIVGFLIALKIAPGPTLKPVKKILSFLPAGLASKLDRLVESVVIGLTTLESVGEVLWVLVVTIFHWCMSITSIWVASRALHLDVSPLGAALIFVFTSLAVTLPQAPGFLGVFQVAVTESLKVLGAPLTEAQGFAMLYWIVCIVPVTLSGFLCMYIEGMTLSEVKASREAAAG